MTHPWPARWNLDLLRRSRCELAITAVAALAAVALAALGCSRPVEAPAPPEVYAAYVLLAQSPRDGAPQAQARVIVDGSARECPQLLGAASPIAMTFRLNPHGFPVKVCQAVIPFNQELTLSWDRRRLPAARENPARIALFGDTGCKEKDCSGDAEATPLAGLAAAAAALDPPPDLVLHAGDYNYRGTGGFDFGDLAGYDAGDDAPDDPRCQLDAPYVSQNAAYSDRPDDWQSWWLDFFQPAQELLAAAPWVFTRGNHELCSRAGPGWFYFLDPSAEADAGGDGQLQCPSQGGETPPEDGALPHLRFAEPYVVDLGTLRVAVIDSANACDAFAPAETTERYARQLARVLGDAPPDRTTWLFSHRPVWGVEGPADGGGWDTLSRTLQQALDRATKDSFGSTLPAGFRLAVAGHMHQFLSVTFTGDGGPAGRPPQLVVGNSGVALYSGDPDGAFSPTVDGQPTAALALAHHGFLDIPRLGSDGSWQGQVVNPPQGEVLATCDTANLPGSLCTQGAGGAE